MPSEMDDLAHRITQLQIEQVSLKKETDALSQSRLHELEKELAELQDKFRSMKAKWENEKNAIGKVQTLAWSRSSRPMPPLRKPSVSMT